MLAFETRHIDDLYDLADPKHNDAERVIISKFEGLTKGCVLAYVPGNDTWELFLFQTLQANSLIIKIDININVYKSTHKKPFFNMVMVMVMVMQIKSPL